MEKRHLFTLFFLVFIIAIFYTVIYMLSPFLKPIIWAVIFTIITYPVFKFLNSKLKSKTLTAVFITLFLIFAFILPVTIVGIISLKEVIELSKNIIAHYKGKSVAQIEAELAAFPIIKKLISLLPKDFLRSEKLINFFINGIKSIANFSAYQLKALIFTTGATVVKLAIFIFTYFFLTKDAYEFGLYIKNLIPLEEKDKEEVLSNIYITTISVVYGTLGTAIIQGTVGIILYYIFSVPYPFVWGFATAYASFIPPLGASMVWFPLSVYLFFKVSMLKGILLAVFSLLFISSMDNIVKPFIMKNRVNTPYIVLFFAVFGGLIKFGFVGMFLGPILFNLLFTLIKIYEEKFLKGS